MSSGGMGSGKSSADPGNIWPNPMVSKNMRPWTYWYSRFGEQQTAGYQPVTLTAAWTTAVAALATQPVVWWRMDATLSNTAGAQTNSGSSGSADAGNTGTGNQTLSQPSLLAVDTNASISFAGVALPSTASGIQCAQDATNLEPSSFSVAALVNPIAFDPGSGNIIAAYTADSGSDGWTWVVDGNTGGAAGFAQTLHLFYYDAGAVAHEIRTANVINADEVSFVVFTFDGTTMKQYLNGYQDANTVTPGAAIHYAASGANLCVSVSTASPFYSQWNGYIDEFMFFNYALTAPQVAALWAGARGAGVPIPGKPYQPQYERAPVLAQ